MNESMVVEQFSSVNETVSSNEFITMHAEALLMNEVEPIVMPCGHIGTVEIDVTDFELDGPNPTVIPKTRASVVTKQVFHLISKGTGTFQRIAYQEGAVYDKEMFFLGHELRGYMEGKATFPFALASYDDLKNGLEVMQRGLDDLDGNHFVTLTGWVKGGEGVTIVLVPEGINVSIQSLGIHSHLKSAKDAGKFMKYLKRLLAMYRMVTFGTHIWGSDELMQFEVEGEKYKVRGNTEPIKGFAEVGGQGAVTARFAEKFFGPSDRADGKWKTGMCARITFCCKAYFFKGHVAIWDMDYDAAFWDIKSQITTDDVFIGYMGQLHAGDLRINLQPVVNAGLQDFAYQMAMKVMGNVAVSFDDPDQMLDMYMSMFGDDINEADDEDSLTSQQICKFRLMSAIRAGFDPKEEPFMMRDFMKSYESELFDLENFRIRFAPEDGIAAYIMFDLFCIGRDGKFHPERARLTGNHVYNSRLRNGERVVSARDPEAPNEYVNVYNALPPSGFADWDENVLFVSIFIAQRILGIMGGGDWDDRVKIYRNPAIVAHFLDMPKPYKAKEEIVHKAMKIRNWIENNVFAEARGMHILNFDTNMLSDQIAAAMANDAGMGQIINWLMFCIYLSLNKTELLANGYVQLDSAMAEGDKAHIEKLMQDLEWLEAYVPFHEWDVANDLEAWIDGLAMDKGNQNYAGLGQRITDFWDACRCVPLSFTFGGFMNGGRIPVRCINNHPTVLVGPICEVQQKLFEQREMLRDTVNAAQWKGVKPCHPAIFTYPGADNAKLKEFASTMYEKWIEDNKALREHETGDKKVDYKAFRDVCKAHRARLDRMPEAQQLMLIAELERRCHNRAYSQPGLYPAGGQMEYRPRPYPDGYLNNPEFFDLRVKLHAQEGLTQPLHRVPLYGASVKLARMQDVQVSVKDCVVTQYEDGKIIGFDDQLTDGQYAMRYGVVRLHN